MKKRIIILFLVILISGCDYPSEECNRCMNYCQATVCNEITNNSAIWKDCWNWEDTNTICDKECEYLCQ